MTPEFTAHNIRLDDGSLTMSDGTPEMADHPWMQGVMRVLDATLPRPWDQLSVIDLGCLEGGYAVELARAGFDVCGLDVRESNLEACRYVASRVSLPNLRFVLDDAMNIDRHGPFDVTFCSGLLYHLDRPVAFLRKLGEATRKLVILQTHFAPQDVDDTPGLWDRIRGRSRPPQLSFGLSPLAENEGVQGRWYQEFSEGEERDQDKRWASWDNATSFWMTRPAILQTLRDAGFDLVFEQFDNLTPDIAASMTTGDYAKTYRSTFIGLKTGG